MNTKHLVIAALLLSGLSAAAPKKTVAVVNFTNASGSRSLDYLKTALPESISGSLSSSREIRVVERAELAKVLKEIELEQSGLVNTGEVARAGKLARADVLLLGTFSGNAEKITVTLKAVDVTTGVVLEGRSASAPLSDILEQCSRTSLAMASAIAGGKTGLLTVTTVPDGAEVLIDGIVVGRTPVVEYKLSAGQHNLFLRKEGFQEEEKTITVSAAATERVTETLAPARQSVQAFLAVGYQRMLPLNEILKQGNLITVQLGMNFGRWTADLTYTLNPSWDHSYTYSSIFEAIQQKRSYLYNAYLLGIAFEPLNSQYISPYVGVFGGYTKVSDYEIKGSDSKEEKIASFDLLQLGAKAGVEIMPKMKVSFFLEGRYNYFPRSINRTTKVSNGALGEPSSVVNELNLTNWSFGGGVRLNF